MLARLLAATGRRSEAQDELGQADRAFFQLEMLLNWNVLRQCSLSFRTYDHWHEAYIAAYQWSEDMSGLV